MLVVDDEVLIRWSIGETLAHAGHAVIEAADAAAAMRAVNGAAEPFDVVLVDYTPSRSNDLALLAKIRHWSPTSTVVLMTAFGTPEVVRAAHELGVSRVLNKPFDMHAIGNVVLGAHHG